MARYSLADRTYPLSGLVVFHSTDVYEAEERVGRIFCPHKLHPHGSGVDARHHCAPFGPVGLNYVTYQDDVEIIPGPLESFFVIQAPLTGAAEIRCGRRSIESFPGVASVPNPDEHLEMRWSPDCGQLITWIDRRAWEQHVTTMLGRSLPAPIRPQLGFNLRWGPGRAWWRLARELVDAIDNGGGILPSPLATADAAHELMNRLSLALPTNLTELLLADHPAAGRREVRQAVELIEHFPKESWTAAMLADQLGHSAASLQRAFRRYVGYTVRECVREVRLRHIYAILLAADPKLVTASDVAMEWGFAHYGRFADWYCKQHDETPSTTLSRAA